MKRNETANVRTCDRNRLLIVDDEKAILRLFRMILCAEFDHLDVDLAENGDEALRTWRQVRHGLVLLDLHMPVMDGYHAFRGMQDLCRQKAWQMPRVVFCTGFAPPDTISTILKREPQHALLPKPISPDELITAVRMRLDA
jgi:two-component system response regulator AdeR